MTLKDAVITILRANDGALTADEICKQKKEQNLFKKGDGSYPDVKYLLLRIKFYSEDFQFTVRLKD
jgi:hypothetical protein